MILNQFFDPVSSTFTYLIAARAGSEAMLIDPVDTEIDQYLEFLGKRQLRLTKVFDTHTHADHISGMSKLRDITRCTTMMGNESPAVKVSVRLKDTDLVEVGELTFEALHTPGHTNDSYALYGHGLLFTGDTLLIRSTGRTDFQGGSAADQYQSIFGKLLRLPPGTQVYPGHDYKGENVTTLELERLHNPRLNVANEQAYVKVMSELKLPRPELMDVAVPANQSLGTDIQGFANLGHSISIADALKRQQSGTDVFIDIREASELNRSGTVPGALHYPFPEWSSDLTDPDSELIAHLKSGDPIILFCAYGERSGLALNMIADAGLPMPLHLEDGYSAWKEAGAPIAQGEQL